VTGLANTLLLQGAVRVTGIGIPLDTFVQSVDSATQVTLNQQATANGPQSLSFEMEPITLPQAKLQAKVVITQDDSLIADYLTTARKRTETEKSKTWLTTTYDLFLDCFPNHARWQAFIWVDTMAWAGWNGDPYESGRLNRQVHQYGEIKLPRPPLQSIVSINYTDMGGAPQVLDPSQYIVSTGTPGRVCPAPGTIWPFTQYLADAVRIRFLAGYGDTADKAPSCVRTAMKLLVGHYYKNREATTELPTKELPLGVADVLAPEESGWYC
jgi:hypothetical protein